MPLVLQKAYVCYERTGRSNAEESTHVYGPRGAPLFPTPLLSKTNTEYSGLRAKWSTCVTHPAELEFNLSRTSMSDTGSPDAQTDR